MPIFSSRSLLAPRATRATLRYLAVQGLLEPAGRDLGVAPGVFLAVDGPLAGLDLFIFGGQARRSEAVIDQGGQVGLI